ncbi:MAG: helix-hairpin-helix domain-containing protein [Phycisphaeraceae bacterium]|nr:helix-hairpin-helix domain-containing protein [Phycisphaeraceae bacterium]
MRTPARRGTVVFAVLVVITLGALAAATVLVSADASIAEAEVTVTRAQTRALAWSGVQVVMAELSSQRDALLDGRSPRITEEWELFTDEAGRRWMVRLVDLGVPGGVPIVSESGKLDLNTATEAMLALLPGVGDALAKRIVEARAERPLASVDELLSVEGFTPEMVYGEDAGAAGGSLASEGASLPLADLVTVFSFDPNVQSGAGDDPLRHRGRKRVNLNQAWSDSLRGALVERFGEGVAQAVEQIMKNGTEFKSESDFVRVMRFFQVPPADWAEALDALCTSDDDYLLGRVDLNTAPAEALACVPGIDAAMAEEIVAARERLDDSARKSVAWPAAEGIVPEAEFQEAVPWLTTRAMQWRVRVEAGVAPAESVVGPGDAPALVQRMVLEAVIDVSSQRPRVAYLRDVTLLPLARRLYAGRTEEAADEWPEDEADLLEDPEETATASGLPPLEWERWATNEPTRMSPSSIASGGESTGSAGAARVDGFGYDGERGAESSSGGDPGVSGVEAAPSAGGDPRIGRWTPRRARSR